MAKRTKKSKARKAAKKPARKPARRAAARKASGRRAPDALLAPIKGATAREIGGVRLDVASAGAARVKRMIYPPGFK
ncbi:MAG TPA: hypothetical protein VL919_13780, partial [Vicinamibacterales bacterium]|nr:hypothetical protein [Vicinamibacterales bacterium]